jgi:hypothetical protein
MSSDEKNGQWIATSSFITSFYPKIHKLIDTVFGFCNTMILWQ